MLSEAIGSGLSRVNKHMKSQVQSLSKKAGLTFDQVMVKVRVRCNGASQTDTRFKVPIWSDSKPIGLGSSNRNLEKMIKT